MSRNRNTNSIFAGVDWVVVLLYVSLVIIGWTQIYAASYYENKPTIFDFHREYGKQFIWMTTAFALGFLTLVLDAGFWTIFAYGFYAFFLFLNLIVPFLGAKVKGSHSWFRIGDFGIQPAEFMKFATNLAIAKFLSNANLQVDKVETKITAIVRNYKNTFIALAFLLFPMMIIKVLQDETGLAIVFAAFIISMYREGLTVSLIIISFVLALLFVVALAAFRGDWQLWPFHLTILAAGGVYFLFSKRRLNNIIRALVIVGAASTIIQFSPMVYKHIPEHQKKRMDVFLYFAFGVGQVNLDKEAFNVDQSMTTIGCGRMFGTGYMEGAQTKSGLVPEQKTDFIFCTVGEEWGFIGSMTLILLQLGLVIKLIFMAERQRSDFSRIYGYGVAGIMFFHIVVNIGMTLGLVPVIGIPLPFVSYGGSSLWSFTILLFIFLKLDANRMLVLR
ncbi:MAG: rod shape-determining protein RodA [Bacteroidota bacterium]